MKKDEKKVGGKDAGVTVMGRGGRRKGESGGDETMKRKEVEGLEREEHVNVAEKLKFKVE